MHKEFFHKGFLIPEKQQAAEISFLEYLHEHAKLCDVQDALAVLPEYDNSVIDVIKTYVPLVLGIECVLDSSKHFEEWLITKTDIEMSILANWAVSTIVGVCVGLLVMSVLKQCFWLLFSNVGVSTRTFILNALREWEKQNGVTCVGLANGEYIHLKNNVYKVFDEKSDRTFDYKNAYSIDVQDGNITVHYCLFSNKSYNITKNTIVKRFIKVSSNHRDWSRHSQHLFAIAKIHV